MIIVIPHATPNRNKIQARAIKNGWRRFEEMMSTEHSRVVASQIGDSIMPSITEIADEFFVACETGKGWEACKAFCTPGATFAAQAEPLAGVKSLNQYCDWMKRYARANP